MRSISIRRGGTTVPMLLYCSSCFTFFPYSLSLDPILAFSKAIEVVEKICYVLEGKILHIGQKYFRKRLKEDQIIYEG